MINQEFIEAAVFCSYHEVDYSFVNALEENGLIELTVVDHHKYIPGNQLSRLEQIVRLHHELDINLEGIEAVLNVLQRIENLQKENMSLKNKLRFYISE